MIMAGEALPPLMARHWFNPNQASHCVRTFDALLRNELYEFLYAAHLQFI